MPLGLPDWRGLLTELKGEPLTGYCPANAPKIAQRIVDKIGANRLHAMVALLTAISDVSSAHLLLAGLGVRQNVATNYGLAYESALTGRLNADSFRTVSRQLAIESQPWLLKMHSRPESIVLTTDDYIRLESDHRSVLSVVETLVLTSHLIFLGYSLKDDDFTTAGERVRQSAPSPKQVQTSTSRPYLPSTQAQ